MVLVPPFFFYGVKSGKEINGSNACDSVDFCGMYCLLHFVVVVLVPLEPHK